MSAAVAPAFAAVTISSAATENITCSGGICAPTADNAVLNASDLEALLASGNVEVTTKGSGVQAGSIRVKAPFGWSTTSTLSLVAHRTIEVDQAVSVTGSGGMSIVHETGSSSICSSDRKAASVFPTSPASSRSIVEHSRW